ncbi:3-deoxy-7-phosphoheptulonate synthase [Candidatus Carsonella ruddii]|uniref:3-deoxy-7-phosphoheptulonate synthase n=1 Tax=Candidatus Carsonella ruddii CE isolate Thao2000 TaxID=1202536 RepID=J7GZY9_CARRU|nr:3-deoxy-7-phosphoheptulonate synthase [Candidatus Carsonella ruddii]AFP83580.1 3-deoxy-7-phosphoheptulonate synthase [Candidatus Carsonella ruddii CE isolate Thao2000]
MFNLINLKRIKKDLNFIFINNILLKNIVLKKIKKFILIIGPCSISNIKDFILYLKKIKNNFKNIILIIRVYYEKPRTNIGWKGYIYDPYIDESYSINDSIYIIRRLLLDISKQYYLGTECLNFFLINYFIDCISWICIGARTIQSQIHREFCSNLNCVIGIKNDIYGDLNVLKDSLLSIMNKQCFVNFFEKTNFIYSKGNKYIQFVLRGGKEPNFSKNLIFNNSLIIDCSHSNSLKVSINQIYVFENILNQYFLLKNIHGVMFEHYIYNGNQNIKNIKFGLSITDSCLNFKFYFFILKKINDLQCF